MNIAEYTEKFQQEVIDLITGIQQDELGIKITADDQPDLKSIISVYQKGNGNFWISEDDGRVVGTIALIDTGNSEVALRKMFVHRDYRGKEKGVAQQLINNLFEWCVKMNVQAIYLGTIDSMKAAHRFYEKNGFQKIVKQDMPATFPVMQVDNVFYKFLFKENA
jgi:N-acetylglutamate synthase-like GNAT family acetyltransferase